MIVLLINDLPSTRNTKLVNIVTPTSEITATLLTEEAKERTKLKYIANPKEERIGLLSESSRENWMCFLATRIATKEDVAMRPAA